jgi:hypothetical protein
MATKKPDPVNIAIAFTALTIAIVVFLTVLNFLTVLK